MRSDEHISPEKGKGSTKTPMTVLYLTFYIHPVAELRVLQSICILESV